MALCTKVILYFDLELKEKNEKIQMELKSKEDLEYRILQIEGKLKLK